MFYEKWQNRISRCKNNKKLINRDDRNNYTYNLIKLITSTAITIDRFLVWTYRFRMNCQFALIIVQLQLECTTTKQLCEKCVILTDFFVKKPFSELLYHYDIDDASSAPRTGRSRNTRARVSACAMPRAFTY